MSDFNFYKADKAYGELYFQFPKVLLYSEEYSKLSDSAKLAYVIFRDRLQYSIQNHWIDEENNVYFIFTNKELCELLNKSENTVTKIKKELEKAGLLLQQKMGFDPVKKKNFPNRLYLADLEVNATDIYQLQQREEILSNQGIAKNAAREEVVEKPLNQGTANFEGRENKSESRLNQGTVKNEVNLYQSISKDIKENKDIQKPDENTLIQQAFNPEKKDQEQEQQLIDDYIEKYALYEEYGEEIIHHFKAYSFNDFQTFTLYCEKVMYAKKSVEDESGIYISILSSSKYSPFIREELKRTFTRCVQQSRFGKTKNISSYLFISFKNVFEDFMRSQVSK
ncbi:replication initiator protein A [Desemzia sp. RIT804]|uniref:replication initiator protein A n=1 Tax=Desemzia sp. RIT 804 TaxID=2810209 RepID=UPI00195132DD|nr:replication initiator protein A [Desemzia sp. RIT 804]MBM6613985.1 replication initiator protein A [Desemzia sp. RIT 804]MBM6614068.1 replication initiator protein A [Desemzia sp. RIT 804]MBM6614151.1 replication initiator protein A [Desemzia sp. RIT 804]